MKDKNIARIIIGTVCILLIPLVAMLFTDEVVWTLSDFLIIGALLLGAGFTYELIVHNVTNKTHRVILGVVFILAVIVVWIDLAVGIFNIPGISGS